MKALPECTRLPGFERLKAYLADDSTHLKRLQLSSKLADIFDQYQVFRPQMIFRWEQGKPSVKNEHPEDEWQAHLWRQLMKNGENRNNFV